MVLFRGKTIKGDIVKGSLVVTNAFIKHKPKSHTKTWIIQSAFGNGGWFNIRRRQYVKPDTVEQYVETLDDGTEIWKKCEIQ